MYTPIRLFVMVFSDIVLYDDEDQSPMPAEILFVTVFLTTLLFEDETNLTPYAPLLDM